MLRKLLIICAILGSFFMLACSSTEKVADEAEALFTKAQELEKNSHTLEAIERYKEVKNKFPYSKFAPLAELAIADLHYKDESYAEAQVYYSLFKELRPRHEKIAYVTHRIGLSYFNQLPPTADRDLSLATSAISHFDEVISKYQNSEHYTEAAEKKKATLALLAEKELYIADYYFKKQKWLSALNRYEGLIKSHKNLGYDAQALKGAAISAARIGDKAKAQKYLAQLSKDFPNSSELSQTQAEVQ